ncbi:MAG: hypothetical protein HLX50_17385 [Alteromonadaceae bacterium]|nr:hypothetical protein [Alteromonadaceae bacterium]
MDFIALSWWTVERVSAAANAGLFLVAIITAAGALIAIFQTKKIIQQNEEARTENSKQALESQKIQEEYNRTASESAHYQAKAVELQRESVERANRPMMMAQYLPPKTHTGVLDLEISNAGKTIACQVTIKFSPELPKADLEMLNSNSESGQHFHYPNVELPRVVFATRKFPSWVPAQKVSAPFWVLHKNFKFSDPLGISAESIPANQKVIITYEDEQGHPYEDTFQLDPGIWAGKTFQDSETLKQRKALEKLSKSTENFGQTLTRQMQLLLNRTTSPTQEELDKIQKRNSAIAQIRNESNEAKSDFKEI